MNKEIKSFNLLPIFSCKYLWDFDRKCEYNKILDNWKIIFQVSDTKGQQFLKLLNNNLNSIELLYAKDGPWLKLFGHSNLLYARTSRVIVVMRQWNTDNFLFSFSLIFLILY